jgi:hypothetical protein
MERRTTENKQRGYFDRLFEALSDKQQTHHTRTILTEYYEKKCALARGEGMTYWGFD